jgi:multimeric flavodoxin WrbA
VKVLCISASNIIHKAFDDSTSFKLCKLILECLPKENYIGEIVDLRTYKLQPCIGCGQCFETHRCVHDKEFNCIYENIISSNIIFIVSPHYAPIPAKLCMLLEKMEQITFLHWAKDTNYKSEVYGISTGIISHGGGSDWALPSYKAMVNDTIANALDTIQLKLIPYSQEWNTGISIPVASVVNSNNDIFPQQEYDWSKIKDIIHKYISKVIQS